MRSDILNLNVDSIVHIFPTTATEFKVYMNKLPEYNGKRYKENYNTETIKAWMDQGRFNLGVVQLYLNDTLCRALFIEEHKGWVFISRMISWEYANLPLLTSFVLPKVFDYAKKNSFRGLYASVNEGNKIYFNCLTDSNKMSSRSPLFDSHRDVVSNITLLPNPVIINYVSQYVAYKGCNDDCRIEELL